MSARGLQCNVSLPDLSINSNLVWNYLFFFRWNGPCKFVILFFHDKQIIATKIWH